jgi:hypothetical protein
MQTERKNITQPPDWWEVFSAEATSEGLTLSEWMGKICKAALPQKQQKTLSIRPPAHRPKNLSEK